MAIDCTSVPKHLKVMRSITGIEETSGSGDNPKILGMRDWIACTYSDMKEYCEGYTGDDVAWCGLATAFCCTVAGVRPPYDPDEDTGSFLWAQSFADDPGFEHQVEPCLGTICVMTREGGGHVTMFEGWVNSSHTQFKGRGGNQSDEVNVSTYDVDDIIAWVWPRGVPVPAPGPTPSPDGHPDLEKGDDGPAVAQVQSILGLPADGEFGSITESGVQQFQGACGLAKDGQVGPMTWDALDDLDSKMQLGDEGLDTDVAEQIEQLCEDSPLNGYEWPDRGEAPSGYYVGMAKSFAWALQNNIDDAVTVMAAKATTNDDIDALAWYASELKKADLDTSKNGADTLRALFVLMIGLGMRESSGNHWEGRDMSADNVQSNTAEAGLFQTSWDIAPCSSTIPPLLEIFWDDPNGFRPDFDVGVEPTASNLDAYGSGDGARYQFLAKFSPLFHVLVTGVGMRKRRQHWGPINRKEVDLVGMVDDLLIEVQQLVANA